MTEELKRLCSLPGVSGREDAVREYILAQIESCADSVSVDAMGNVIAFVKGKKAAESGKKLMLCAHMDEVGIIVTEITDDGYLKFDFIGEADRRSILGKTVFLGEKAVPGVIGMKAIHLTEKAERSRLPKTDAMYVDIGAESREEAEKLVSPGDTGCFDAHAVEFGDGFLRAKALDGRVGCAVLLALIRRGSPADAWFVFTAQEEVGCRGAAAAAYRIRPDLSVVLSSAAAADLPGLSGGKKGCSPGKGPVLPVTDGGTIYDRGLYRSLNAAAEKQGIPVQNIARVFEDTDAKVIQRSGSGVRTAALSAALRGSRTPSCVGRVKDFEDMLRLLTAYMEEL